MSTIDTETISTDAHLALHEHDNRMVGTPAYLGIAYFWNYAYRYPMRDVSYSCRRRIHAAMLDAGLPLDEASETHRRLIEDTMNATDRKRLVDCYGRAWVTPGVSVAAARADDELPPLRSHQTPDGATYATSRLATEGAPR